MSCSESTSFGSESHHRLCADCLFSIAISSCAIVDRNGLAVEVDHHSLTPQSVEALASTDGTPATGDQLREQLTKWIRVTVLEGSAGAQTDVPAPATSAELDQRYALAVTNLAGEDAKALYETGVDGSPVICIAAVTTANLDDANAVLTLLNSGMAFEDAARQHSTDTVIAQAGGIVRGGVNGDQECLDPATVNPAVVAALKGTPVGQPIAADLDTFSAVLMLRPSTNCFPSRNRWLRTTVLSQDHLMRSSMAPTCTSTRATAGGIPPTVRAYHSPREHRHHQRKGSWRPGVHNPANPRCDRCTRASIRPHHSSSVGRISR